jgi:AcrR family transcriptional regulator
MVRPSNPERPAKLLDAVVVYLVKNGVANLSLRPLAKAVGSSNRGLLYHFGSKEGIVDKAFALPRERQRAAYETRGMGRRRDFLIAPDLQRIDPLEVSN